MRLARVLALGLALLWSQTVGAVDGVVEINQTRAAAGGVTPGDTAGFPVTIDRPGSYRLTGNLDVRGEPTPQDVTAIDVTASGVTLDLNGFAILGPTTCSGSPPASALVCAPLSGAVATLDGAGVRALANDVAVRNGTIHGMGLIGVFCGVSCVLEDLLVIENGLGGASVGASFGSVVRGSGFVRNGGTAGLSGDGTFAENHARHNAGIGIQLLNSGTARGNYANGNGGAGLEAFRATLTGNASINNGGSGIKVFGESVVLQNACRDNSRYGLEALNGNNGFAQNMLEVNDLGAACGAATDLGQNIGALDPNCAP